MVIPGSGQLDSQQEYRVITIIKNNQDYEKKKASVSHSKVMIPCQFPYVSHFSDLEFTDLKTKFLWGKSLKWLCNVYTVILLVFLLGNLWPFPREHVFHGERRKFKSFRVVWYRVLEDFNRRYKNIIMCPLQECLGWGGEGGGMIVPGAKLFSQCVQYVIFPGPECTIGMDILDSLVFFSPME